MDPPCRLRAKAGTVASNQEQTLNSHCLDSIIQQALLYARVYPCVCAYALQPACVTAG